MICINGYITMHVCHLLQLVPLFMKLKSDEEKVTVRLMVAYTPHQSITPQMYMQLRNIN